ncbi:hypothetical protein B0H15DRAFT_137329 [Mycena belliarum]|uniref:Uncharacterized protein n=1 Tax=Mycena belliarum TaxID=1033014 RepID=A0AAD6XRT9_9AGAR|nr:hypothetical protein B0H15DRAFT_137329 [Mycena belliae]
MKSPPAHDGHVAPRRKLLDDSGFERMHSIKIELGLASSSAPTSSVQAMRPGPAALKHLAPCTTRMACTGIFYRVSSTHGCTTPWVRGLGLAGVPLPSDYSRGDTLCPRGGRTSLSMPRASCTAGCAAALRRRQGLPDARGRYPVCRRIRPKGARRRRWLRNGCCSCRCTVLICADLRAAPIYHYPVGCASAARGEARPCSWPSRCAGTSAQQGRVCLAASSPGSSSSPCIEDRRLLVVDGCVCNEHQHTRGLQLRSSVGLPEGGFDDAVSQATRCHTRR